MFTRLIFAVVFVLIIDLINTYGLRKMLGGFKDTFLYKFIFYLYWLLGLALALYFIIHFLITGYPGEDYIKYRSFFFIFGLFILLYLPRIVYSFFVVWQSSYYGIKKILKPRRGFVVKRNQHRHYLIQKIGLYFAMVMFFAVLYGLIWGKSDFVVKEQTLYFKDLPAGFDGFKIAQISDAHLGSFTNYKDVRKGISLLSEQDADMIVFTGDMVNNVAEEVNPYIEDFTALKPPMGKYAILGNHDMGDYVKWKKADMKYAEIKQIIDSEENMGFEMLLNENTILRRNGDSIALMGVENWGKPPFRQYGNLEKTMRGVENFDFKILMTHDPSHFKMQVLNKTNIQLSFSGHTHGMQFGIDCCGIKWSPIKFLYPQWSGLYKFDEQYLYVNQGFGFLGMPARIGIRPEITIIILKRKVQHE